MPQKDTEIENPLVIKGVEKPQCHIHDEVGFWEVDYFRENICVNDEPLTEFEGKHYCLFHLPTKDKDIFKFMQIFTDRLEAVKQKVGEIKKLPEDKQAEAKRGFSYDFRYVWFPSEADFNKHKFIADARFRSATFSAGASFNSATFSGFADFSFATFSATANFYSATFKAFANFSSATFKAFASFSFANFEELSQIFFIQTKFLSRLDFIYTNIKVYVAFEGTQDNQLFWGKMLCLICKRQ
jgi:hypothetical protein